VLGVVGESGSGKSMTALAVLGLLPRGGQASGAIRFEGQDLARLSEVELCRIRGARIGMVFQEPMTALNPVMTIGDQVAEVVRLHQGGSRQQALTAARRALDRVGLPADRFPLNRYPHELSGGQRQRVAIAIAIVLSPRLIIADEPTTALDVTTQAQILNLLRQLVREDGAALILVSHDLAVVADIADRVAVMKDGQIVEQDETAALFANLSHPYTRALAADAARTPVRRGKPDLTAPPVLEARAVVRDYPGPRRFLRASPAFRAVSEVSLAIRPGEIVGLVGESGCGKSTLLRTLLALEAPQGGQIRVGRRDLRAELAARAASPCPGGVPGPPRQLRSALDRRASSGRTPAPARHQAHAGRAPRQGREGPVPGRPASRRRRPLSAPVLGRPAPADRHRPRPDRRTLGDRLGRGRLGPRRHRPRRGAGPTCPTLDELGLAYLFVSHDMGVVRGLTDRVLVMKAGRIVEEGPTAEVFSDPQHPYTAQLIAATPDLQRALAARA
jgi:peptide/nickel transport system ATP-binding protein